MTIICNHLRAEEVYCITPFRRASNPRKYPLLLPNINLLLFRIYFRSLNATQEVRQKPEILMMCKPFPLDLNYTNAHMAVLILLWNSPVYSFKRLFSLYKLHSFWVEYFA